MNPPMIPLRIGQYGKSLQKNIDAMYVPRGLGSKKHATFIH